MTSNIDERRLRDGELAMKYAEKVWDDLSTMTIGELEYLYEKVGDGAAAMQSLDELDSPEANDAACDQAQDLVEKLKKIKAEYQRRGIAPRWG